MKKILLLPILLGLVACDKPNYDVDLLCEQSGSKYLVNARTYNDKAVLKITTLDKSLREKDWLKNHTWLESQIPQIDDILDITLKGDCNSFEEPEHIKFDIHQDNLTQSAIFTLWFASDNNLKMSDGNEIPNGEYMVGTQCKLLIPHKSKQKNIKPNLSDSEIKKIKNCNAYIASQLSHDGSDYHVYDEKGRTTLIPQTEINALFGENKPHFYYVENINYYADKLSNSCEIAEKLKTLIKNKLESVKHSATLKCAGTGKIISPQEKTSFKIYDDYAIVENLNPYEDATIILEDSESTITKLNKIQDTTNNNKQFILFESENGIQIDVVIDTNTNQAIEYSWSNKNELSPDGLRIWNMCE
ncbi:MAG: hypothetical protein IJY99_00530 [Alphaproteobacteria bacterium]|nr:hypothetical protein [Alphaproteobacteria bacterium]